MDLTDKTLLDILQKEFPLDSTPFRSIGQIVGISEHEVIRRIALLKSKGVIRQISPIFDSSRIGYHSTLGAFRAEQSQIESVADFLNRHAGISHNYLRDGDYNIWFTLTMPVRHDLKEEIISLAAQTAVQQWLYVPTIKTYKIGFTLDMAGNGSKLDNSVSSRVPSKHLDEVQIDRDFIRILQKDLPLVENPFREAACVLRRSESEVVEMLRLYVAAGLIRRVAAVLRPSNAGFKSNVLAAWSTGTEEQTEILGTYAAGKNAVSHCYQRLSSVQWPYTIYTMIHGQSAQDCEVTIADIVKNTGIDTCCRLVTRKEFKKVRVIYYENGEGNR